MHTRGTPIGGNKLELDCCMNPKNLTKKNVEDGMEGQIGDYVLDDGSPAKTQGGRRVLTGGQGERICRADTKSFEAPGICVWKDTGKPG